MSLEPEFLNKWPKTPPILSQEQLDAREKYMKLWHEELPKKYGIIEVFNHGFPSKLPVQNGWKTLEVGAGLGSHLKYENLKAQDYYCLEFREEFCKDIRKIHPADHVVCGSIEEKTPWPDGFFDRVVAIHVLEHLRNLPAALAEIKRILKPGGFLDIVIPCEGGMAHTFARKISAERLFRKNFKMDFTPIHKNEHVNTFGEIDGLLKKNFRQERRSFFPLKVPLHTLNLAAGFRLKLMSED